MSIYTIDPKNPPEACIIWLHGLGADASDMQGLVQQLPLIPIPVRHVFLDAPLRPVTINNGMRMRAWYDITGFSEVSREDKEGIEASGALIRNAMEQQLNDRFSHGQIFLAGFSQGGAMALHTALHTNAKLAGVLALSSYLPLHASSESKLDKNTPIFMASGINDPIVLPLWTQFAKQWLDNAGYRNIAWHQYPMEHSICYQEIQDIASWIPQQLHGAY